MKLLINWRLFFSLLVACVLSSLMVLPYAVSLSPVLADNFSPVLILVAAVQALVIFSVVIYLGLRLADRTGMGAPILTSMLRGEKQDKHVKVLFWRSCGWGTAAGLLVVGISFFFPQLSVEMLQAEVSVGAWKGLLASFYGGIAEEVVFRLFVLGFLVWCLSKFPGGLKQGRPTHSAVWTAIIIAAVLFGLGHLGITSDLTTLTAQVILRAILLNGVPGVIFGWLYWRMGLESAIIAHFSADIVLHVITPLVASSLFGF